MRVRCGACRSNVTITRPGRFSCPKCGAVNQVKGAAPGADSDPSPGQEPPPPHQGPGPPGYPGIQTPGPPIPPPPQPEAASPRVSCPECSFSFIVGLVQTVICPNCRAEVSLPGAEA